MSLLLPIALERWSQRKQQVVDDESRRKISVVHIATDLSVGGAAETAIALCALLPKDEFKATLVSGASGPGEQGLLEYAQSRQVEVHFIKNLGRKISPARDSASLIRLWLYLRRLRPEVVQTHSSKPGVVGRIAAWGARVPVVIHTVHGWSFHDGQPGPIRWLARLLERALARLSTSLVVVTTEDEAIGLRERIGHPDQYRLVRSGIDLDRFSCRSPGSADLRELLGCGEQDWIVGTVGRLEPQKDPISLVRVAASVSKTIENVRFAIIGDGSLKEEVLALARSMNLSNRLSVLGMRTDVPDLLHSMDVLVMTSRWEGLPRVIIEAMVAKTPVISTAVGGVGEVIENRRTGVLAPPGDVDALAKGVVEILTTPGMGERLAEAAAAQVSEFSQERMADETAKLYRALLGHARSNEPPGG